MERSVEHYQNDRFEILAEVNNEDTFHNFIGTQLKKRSVSRNFYLAFLFISTWFFHSFPCSSPMWGSTRPTSGSTPSPWSPTSTSASGRRSAMGICLPPSLSMSLSTITIRLHHPPSLSTLSILLYTVTIHVTTH